jgi:hypothetical protein
MDGISAGLTAATKAVAGYQKGQLAAAALGHQLDAENEDRQQRSEDFTARMHNSGYVPTSSAVEPPPIKTGQLLAAITGGGATSAGPIAEPTDLTTPKRYGETVGRFTYDNGSPAAQTARARADLAAASAKRMQTLSMRTEAMTPSPAMRQSLIDAGNDEHDVDAVLATGDPAAIRNLLRPDPIERHAANRLFDVAHPLPSRAGPGRQTNAETPGHRSARQGLSAVTGQIRDDRDQIKAMDRSAPPLVRYPGIATGTSADSASARDFTAKRNALAARGDSLRTVADGLAGTLSRAALGQSPPAPPARSAPPAPAADARAQLESERTQYQAAQAKIRQTFANDPAEMSRRLTAASQRYQQRVSGLRGGGQ